MNLRFIPIVALVSISFPEKENGNKEVSEPTGVEERSLPPSWILTIWWRHGGTGEERVPIVWREGDFATGWAPDLAVSVRTLHLGISAGNKEEG